MKSRNSATKHNALEPMGKPGLSQSHSKDLSNKRNKQSLIPVRSHQQEHPKSRTSDKNESDKYGTSFLAHSGPSIDYDYSRTLSDMERPSLSSRVPKSTVSSQPEVHQDSVVSKYIDRFRYGQPLSREERQLESSEFEEERVPLWWMSSSDSPPTSTPTKPAHKDPKDDHSPARHPLDDSNYLPWKGDDNTNAYIPSDTSQSVFEDTDILQLQERASRLLQIGESILSSGSIAVSSAGLGCSDGSSPVNINEAVQKAVINASIKSTAMARSDSTLAVPLQRYTVTSLRGPPTRPEEDILSQWRLRRKMEQASERCLSQQNSRLCTPTFSGPDPTLHYSPVNKHSYTQQPSVYYPDPSHRAFPDPKEGHGHHPSTSAPHTSAVSDTVISQPQSLAHVPAHMHHLCDILPCPTPHASTFQGNPHKSEKTSRKDTKVSEVSYVDEPPHRHIPSPPPAPSRHTDMGCPFRHTDGGHHSVPRVSSSPSRPLEGGSPSRFTEVGDSLKPKKDNSPSRHMEEGSQSRPGRGGHHENPRMTNETAKTENAQVKQVVASEKTVKKPKKSTRCTECSEHANGPSATSSTHQKVPKKSKTRADPQQQERRKDKGSRAPPSPVHRALGQVVSEVLFPPEDPLPQDAAVSSPPAPPQSSLPPCNAHTSLEVMSQLLQEAEDSDEKEFEDDPLLRVLRTQRKCVKEQISQVDLMLHTFLDKQEDTST
ncbi:proline and serine-rich protein 3 isoform 1-T1 [Syngnathus typhle]